MDAEKTLPNVFVLCVVAILIHLLLFLIGITVTIGTSIVRCIRVDASSSPPTRFGHTLVADPSQNRLLLFGGRNTVESFGDVWAFSVESHVWTQLQCTTSVSKTDVFSKANSISGLSSMSTAADESPITKKSEKRSVKKEKVIRVVGRQYNDCPLCCCCCYCHLKWSNWLQFTFS